MPGNDPRATSDWNLTPPTPSKPLPARILHSEREAAAVLGCCARTVRNLADRGDIPRVRFLSAVRYDHADLLAFIERSKSRSTQAIDAAHAGEGTQ